MEERPPIDVSPANWRIVRDILQRHVADREVWAFGSRAKWTAKEFSDLDLAVVGGTPLGIGLLARLSEEFEASPLPFKVDIVDLSSITRSFRNVVEATKVVLRLGKNSGAGWPEARLDDLKAEGKGAFAMGPFGSRIKAENFVPQGVPVIKGSNLNGDFLDEQSFDFLTSEKAAELSSSEARRLDLVITHRGTIGQVGIVPETSKFPRYIVSQSQLKLTFDTDRVNPYFVYYFLRSPEGQHRLLMNASQVGVPAIAQALTSVRNIWIPYPPKIEQDEIVSVLRALDEKIALIRDTNATLEAIAQALFRSWFVDFDPVRAKAEGREPEGVPPEIAELFPSEFEESELGDIPRGWQTGTLANLCVLNPESWSGKNHPDSVRYLDLANVKENRIEEVVEYSFAAAPSRARRVLRDNDTVVGTVRPGNRSYAFIRNAPPTLTGSTGFAVLRPQREEYSEYVYLAATRQESIATLASLADGGAYPAVRPEVVQQLDVVRPPSELLGLFHDVTSPLMQNISDNQSEAAGLSSLRDTLLPNLMSGRLQLGGDGV